MDIYGRRWLIAILAAAAISFALKVTIARNTYGSLDAYLREDNLKELRRHGALSLYRNGTTVSIPGIADHHHEVFNHPPLAIRLLECWGWMADVSGIPLRFWLRFACAVSDLLSLFLIADILRHSSTDGRPANLFLMAISPVSLMISGFHGNVDPIMVMLTLLSLWLLEREHVSLAGLAMGIAVSIKIVPVIFALAIFLHLSGRRRLEFFAMMGCSSVIAWLPEIVQDPVLILTHVVGYNPQSGIWGLSRFVFVFGPEAFIHAYHLYAKIPLIAIVILVSIWMNSRERKPALRLQLGLIAFLFLALTPGFGVQYLSWLVPWTCLLTFRESLAFHLTGGLLLFNYYNRAAGGLPWDLAYSGQSEWYGSVVYLGLLCWLVICGLSVRWMKGIWGAGATCQLL